MQVGRLAVPQRPERVLAQVDRAAEEAGPRLAGHALHLRGVAVASLVPPEPDQVMAPGGGVRRGEHQHQPVDPVGRAGRGRTGTSPGEAQPQPPRPSVGVAPLAVAAVPLAVVARLAGAAGMAQRGPGVGEVVADVEQPQPVAGEPAAGVARGRLAQGSAAFAGGVVEVQDQVGQRVQVEVVVLRRQFDAPPADRPEILERQVPLVPEAQLEQARVVLAAGRRDRLARGVLADDARVVGTHGAYSLCSRPSAAAAGLRRRAQSPG